MKYYLCLDDERIYTSNDLREIYENANDGEDFETWLFYQLPQNGGTLKPVKIVKIVRAIVKAYRQEISGGWWDDGEGSVYQDTLAAIVNGEASLIYDSLAEYLEDGEDMPLTRHALDLLWDLC